MDDIDVVLGSTFLKAYSRVFKGKKQELVVQSDGKEFVLALTKLSGAFGRRFNFISARVCLVTTEIEPIIFLSKVVPWVGETWS